MDAARWERTQALFHAAADLAPDARAAFLHAESGGDAALAADVLALLEEDTGGGSLLDRRVAEVAAAVLEDGDPLLGRRIGPYRLTALLGEGGMGVVYRAERADVGGVAAIKILRDAALSPARRARFAAERRTLAQLHHPGIARLYDAGTLPDGTPWFAMELVEGQSLTAWRLAAPRSTAARLRLFRAVGEAVQHAHAHAVIHRDLKPSNILVGADDAVTLLDFGIAKQLDADAAPERTRTGLRLMTPAYAAPEQLRGDAVGVHTDVYALGVILYELLTGTLPFELDDRTPGEAERIVLEQEPERPSVRARSPGSTPAQATAAEWADLDVCCLSAMHKEPARRYATVEALLRDVGHYLSGEPLEARGDGRAYRAAKFLGRHARATALAVAMIALLVGLATFYTVRLARARDAAVVEARRTQRIQRFTLSLFQGGEGEVLAADSLRVGTLLERGVREAAALDAEPAVQAELAATLGGIYQRVGAFARADSLLGVALARQRALPRAGEDGVVRRLVALALLRVDQARLDEAERLAREALALAGNAPVRDGAAEVEATEALARVLQERGAYDDAAALFERAMRAHERSDTATIELAGTLVQLAGTHFYAGRYAESDSLNLRALPIYRRLRGPAHPLVADVLINLGAVRFERGAYVEAERYYREALAIVEHWYGPDHHATAAALGMLGRALVSQRRTADAMPLLERSLAIRERVHGPMHPQVASALNELGRIALLAGRLDEAEGRYRRMQAIYAGVYGDAHWLPGVAVSNLGSVAMERRDWVAAEGHYRDAIRRFSASQSPAHLNTGIARVKLGRALLRQRRWTEAVTESRAGLDILLREASPTVSWAVAAREDLAAALEALGRGEEAASYRR